MPLPFLLPGPASSLWPVTNLSGTPFALTTGGGTTIEAFLADLAAADRAWWSYDLAGTLYQTTSGFSASAATEPVGLWLDRANWDGRGVVNLLPYSDNPATWGTTRGSFTGNKFAADGTADSSHEFNRNGIIQSGVETTVSMWLEPVEWSKVFVQLGGAIIRAFDIATLTVGSYQFGTSTASIVNDGGLAKITLTGTPSNQNISVFLGEGNLSTLDIIIAGNVSGQGFIVHRIQAQLGATATAYQRTGAVVGGPGNTAYQSVGNSRASLQTTGVRGDGGDDSELSPFVPGTVLTSLVKAKMGTSGATRTLIGGTVGTARCMLARDSSGLLAAGVGTDSIATIKGGSDLAGLTGTGALVYDGSTVSLYWREVGGALQTLYSAPQNGAPGSAPLRIFATNNGGTAGNFGNDDIQHAIVAKKAATASQIASMTSQLNALA